MSAVGPQSFIFSNGPDQLAHFKQDPASGNFVADVPMTYSSEYGTANSGVALEKGPTKYFVSGHETGNVLIWEAQSDGKYQLVKAADVRSKQAPANDMKLYNVRGLALWQGNVITASEDGDITALSIPDAKEVFRFRYNDAARLGLNSISVAGNWLVASNCAKGKTDKNVWLFDLSGPAPKLSDSENLVLDLGRSQVFNFDTDLAQGPNGTTFFSSTEEGLVWMGKIDAGQLDVTGVYKATPDGAAIMDVSPTGDVIAVAAYGVELLKAD